MDEEKQTDNSQNPAENSPEGLEAGVNPTATVQENTEASTPTTEENAGSPDLEAYAQVFAVAENQEALRTAQLQIDLAQAQAELEDLLRENQQLKFQVDEIKNQYARLGADFDNFRKRTQKEKEEQELQVKCSTIKELLPVVDNFERARSQIKPQTDGEMNIHKSYQSVYKQMVDCLKRIGVAPMRPEGELFDPNLHEAVMRQATDQQPEGTILEELMRGYLLGEKVLRHAMVKVATAPETTTVTEETTPIEETQT